MQKPKCVIICGGRGTRLDPYTSSQAKSMVKINGKPIIFYVLEYWKQLSSEFIFILGYRAEDIINYVKTLDVKAKFIVEKGDPQGIAKALLLAEDLVSGKFNVVLGDCLCSGDFVSPKDFTQGVGIWETNNDEDIKRSYSVEIKDSKIIKVLEKPQTLTNRLCGLGFYFFNDSIFEYIKKTTPSIKTGKVEITDVIQTMIDAGEVITPVILNGKYLNVTYPEDLERAHDLV